MASETKVTPLLAEETAPPGSVRPNPQIMVELVDVAFGESACNLLSARLHSLLVGHLGKPWLEKILLGLQELIRRGEPAGARILAAFLDVSTPGARLIPLVQGFTSTRRWNLLLESDSRPENPFQAEWRRRMARVSREAEDLLRVLGCEPPRRDHRPGLEAPWPAWRRCFLMFLEDAVAGRELMPESRRLMAEMIQVETDAWQERTSNLAGTVNPFNTAAVGRVLPILSRADSQVQDLRQLARWVQEGNDQAAFTNHVSSALEVMDQRDHTRLRQAIAGSDALSPLADLSAGLEANPLEQRHLAGGAARLLALGGQLHAAGLRAAPLSLLRCVRLIQEHGRGNRARVPLDRDLAGAVGGLLKEPIRREGLCLWPLDGLRLGEGHLEVELTDGPKGWVWENFLPTAGDVHPAAVPDPALADTAAVEPDAPEEEAEETADLSASAIKHLVMSNIMSTSVTLGFLRNPKVISIPGLVAEVAARTRNPQIIETIATDRALYTGFANREVPRICLQSPCNTSVKILRKFVHVKYVNKVDLKRMASDRAGMRREVIREIEKYLEALA